MPLIVTLNRLEMISFSQGRYINNCEPVLPTDQSQALLQVQGTDSPARGSRKYDHYCRDDYYIYREERLPICRQWM